MCGTADWDFEEVNVAFQHYRLLVVALAAHLTGSCLCCLICKIGVVIPSSWGGFKDHMT